MREALDKIERQMDDVDLEKFLTDLYVADAIAMQLVVLGEAANRLSDDLKSDYPGIPWRTVIGLRHLIAHEYDKLDLGKLWDFAKSDALRLSSDLPVPPPPGTN